METTYSASTELPIKRDTKTGTRLYGRRLIGARTIWLALAVVAVGMSLIAFPVYFEQLRSLPLDTAPSFLLPARLFAEDIEIMGQLGVSTDVYAGYLTVLWFMRGVILFSIGFVIFWLRSDDRMAILTSLGLVTIAGFTAGGPTTALVRDNAVWGFPHNFMIGLTAATLLGILFAFPDGRFVLRGTMWQGPIWWLGFQLSTLFPGSVLDFFSWPSSIFLAAALASFGYGVYVQIYRYRRISSAVQRQQTKWAVMAFAALIAFSVVFPAIVTTFFPVVERPGLPHILYNVLQQTLFVAAAAIWGISIAFSVLRYRLWDVDLVINRSLIYGALTALLGIVFSVTLLAVQQVMQALTGGMQSPIALAITALVIGALFQPTQKRLHRLINRRLYHVAVDFDKVEAKHPITNPGALSGTNLGQYKVLEPIGRGGMGEVYRGYHPGLDRTVAIKVLPQFFASEQEFAKRFEREAKSVASLNHPNIVQVYDFGYQDGVSYMVMEYINGLELSMMLKQAGKLPIDMVVAIVSKIASALDYAHEQGLVHRDIKPSNIMLEQNGKKYPCAVLMDFGIARLVNSGTRMTGTGMLGTLDYVAPEQIMAAREVDHRADIYSLGVTTYQMLTGTVPFKGGDVANVIFGHLYKPAPNPCGACPNVPPHVAEAVMKAMAKSPIDRFQTAGEFARVILTVTHTSG